MPSLVEAFKRSWLTSLIGLGILCFGIWLLTWNEGRAVNQSHSLDEAYSSVIAVNPYEPVKPELDGHLVYLSGSLEVDEPVTEPDYGISILAVKLKRRVQMYQWVEERVERDPPGDNTDYYGDFYYVTEWRDRLVDSSSFYIRFGHQNPTEIPFKSMVQVSPSVRIGHQMYLGEDMKEKFVNYNEVTGDERPDRKDIKLHAGIYYHCDDVWNPEVGDIRVQFYYAGVAGEVLVKDTEVHEAIAAMKRNKATGSDQISTELWKYLKGDGEVWIAKLFNNIVQSKTKPLAILSEKYPSTKTRVTIIAQQKDKTLVPYKTTKGHEIAFLRHGSLNINQMFNAEHTDAKYQTWKFRLMGIGILYIATIPLSELMGIIFFHSPFWRSIALGDVNPPVNFASALSVSLFVIATAWIMYRPWLGAGLLAAAFSPFIYCSMGVYNAVQSGAYNR